MHEVDLLFECILIIDGQAALPCWFPRSDVQTIVNYIYILAPCEVFLYVFCSFLLFFSFYLCLFCIIFHVPWYDLHNKIYTDSQRWVITLYYYRS